MRELGDGEDETEWIAGTGFKLVYEDEDHDHSGNGALQRLIEDDSQNRLSRLLFHNDNRTPPAARPSIGGWSSVVNLSDNPELEEVGKPDTYTALPKRITRASTKAEDSPGTPKNLSILRHI